jgi:hypothetical protein
MGYLPNDVQLRDLIAGAIDNFRMEDPGAAAAESPSSLPARAYFSGDLQAVIGGINDMTISDSQTTSNDGRELKYKAAFAIRDWYDFNNDRSMFPAYDKYRKDLVALYRSNPAQFLITFNTDLKSAPPSGGNARTGPLNKPLVFTCFMYALKVNGCTRSLFWEASIPFTGSFGRPPTPKPPPIPNPPTPKPPPIPRKPPIPKKRPPPPVLPVTTPPGPETRYEVRPGDYLRKIAKKLYGNE